ncbi:MAG: hypothetical protein ACJA2O_003633 [Candidatus Azotimanducaceae bacterium]
MYNRFIIYLHMAFGVYVEIGREIITYFCRAEALASRTDIVRLIRK